MEQGTRRPRAFGRTSNVWQYVESVHERLTVSAQVRESALDVVEATDETEETEDDDNSDDDPRRRTTRSNGMESFRRPNADTEEEKGREQSTPLQQLSKRKLSKSTAAQGSGGGGARSKRPSKSGLKAVSSLPELHAPLDSGGGRSGALTTTKKSLNPPPLGGGAAIGSPTWRRSGGGPGAGFNSAEVLKRLQALGTSASAPYLPSASAAIPGPSGPATAVGGQPPASGMTQTTPFAGAVAPITIALSPASTGQPPPPLTLLSDAEKLRNDFNSQPSSKLYFGCSVAFELFNGHLLMVGSPDGHVRVQALEQLQAPQLRGCRDRAIFTLLDLADVRSANTISYGDAVWLQLSVGPGDVSWEQGGVLGAQVREAPQLKALALSGDDAVRNTAQAPAVVGHPVPVKAYLPKVR